MLYITSCDATGPWSSARTSWWAIWTQNSGNTWRRLWLALRWSCSTCCPARRVASRAAVVAVVTWPPCRCRRPQRPTRRAGGDGGPRRPRPDERRRPPMPPLPIHRRPAICSAEPFCGACRGAGPIAVRLHHHRGCCCCCCHRCLRRRSSPFNGRRRSCSRFVLYPPRTPTDRESEEKN